MQSRTRTPVRKAPPIAKKSCLKTSYIWSPPLRTLDCAWVGKCRIQTIRIATHHDMVTEFVNTIDSMQSAVFELISVDQSCKEKSFRNKSWGINPLQRRRDLSLYKRFVERTTLRNLRRAHKTQSSLREDSLLHAVSEGDQGNPNGMAAGKPQNCAFYLGFTAL